jgi:hypothetical protein
MTSPIERLPAEVFDLIASGLALPAYQELRLASRQLHSLSISPFSKKYFTDVTTTLGSPSLDRLVNISKHGYFRESVVLLDIKVLTHRDYKLLTNIQKVGIYPPPKRFAVVPGIQQKHISGESTLYDDVLGRQYPQCITGRLTKVLECFPNCKKIRFRGHHSEPIGWQSIAMPFGDQLFRARCFEAVFDAIIASKIQLESLSMAKKKKGISLRKCADLTYPILHYSYSSSPQLQHCFAHLRSLTITTATAYTRAGPRGSGWEKELGLFIACAPNLRKLTLSLDRRGLVSHDSAAIIRSLALSCRLSSLETLHLTNCALQEVDLLQFLTTHAASLTCFHLTHVRLLSWDWESFWVSLQKIPGLRRVHLADLKGPSGRTHIFFGGDQKKSKCVLDVEKAGREMCELLDEVLAAVREDESNVPNGVHVV